MRWIHVPVAALRSAITSVVSTCRLGLQDRVYKCECCGFVLDRDRNSAINMLIGAGFIPGSIGTLSRSDAAVHGRAVPAKAKIPRP